MRWCRVRASVCWIRSMSCGFDSVCEGWMDLADGRV
jgi:hypothetical protein